MSHSTATVIRRQDTVMDDPFHFQVGLCEQPSLPGQALPATAPQVRVAENHAEYVILEVLCGWGRKSYVKCEYSNT